MDAAKSRKIKDGLYRVTVGGCDTRLVIGRGDPPKYRQRQEWHVGVMEEGREHPRWLFGGVHGLGEALEAVATLHAAMSAIQ